MSDSDATSAPVPSDLRLPPAAPTAEPFSTAELGRVLRLPARLSDLVLGEPGRIRASIELRRALPALAGVLLLASVVGALPYGMVLGVAAFWRVAVLYLGSTLICLPSLHVFSSYLGLRVAPLQTVVLALTIPAVAAVFCAGFAPIVGFLRVTMDEAAGHLSWRAVSGVLLWIALAAGIAQLWRCALAGRRPVAVDAPPVPFQEPLFLALILAWLGVFLYVLTRMGTVLSLFG